MITLHSYHLVSCRSDIYIRQILGSSEFVVGYKYPTYGLFNGLLKPNQTRHAPRHAVAPIGVELLRIINGTQPAATDLLGA